MLPAQFWCFGGHSGLAAAKNNLMTFAPCWATGPLTFVSSHDTLGPVLYTGRSVWRKHMSSMAWPAFVAVDATTCSLESVRCLGMFLCISRVCDHCHYALACCLDRDYPVCRDRDFSGYCGSGCVGRVRWRPRAGDHLDTRTTCKVVGTPTPDSGCEGCACSDVVGAVEHRSFGC